MATATTQASGLSNEQLIEVLELVHGAESVELKPTVPAFDRCGQFFPTVRAAVDAFESGPRFARTAD